MSNKPLTRGKFYGLGEPGVKILFAVTYWWNDNELQIRGVERRFSTHQDLPLEDMFRGINWKYDEAAHERLLDKGFLEKTYVARRKIDWAPTQRGRNIIRDILSRSEHLAPWWLGHTDRSGPLYGNPNENVVHRKAVLIAGRNLFRIPWAYDISEPGEPIYGLEFYPIGSRDKPIHDFHLTTKPRLENVGVEAITDSENIEQVIEKWKRFQKMERITFWIFDRRETACKLWNALDERGRYHLKNEWFKTPSSWATEAINQKIWRSSLLYRGKRAGDIVFTLTEVLEGGQDVFTEKFREYLSYE